MRPEAYCVDCGEQTSGSKRCSKCGQINAWIFRDKRKACSELRADINAEFKEFGIHSQCRGCPYLLLPKNCVQYAAPHSQIIFCPRIEAQLYQSIQAIV
jgi:hypothetical protein